jgi:hypothetical protein
MSTLLNVLGMLLGISGVAAISVGFIHLFRSKGMRADIQTTAMLTTLGAVLWSLASFVISLSKHAN